jgi:hypothetical protein
MQLPPMSLASLQVKKCKAAGQKRGQSTSTIEMRTRRTDVMAKERVIQ